MGPSPSPWCSQSLQSYLHVSNITIHGTSLEQVNSFIYLGSMFTSDGRCVQDVRRRIGIAKSAFTSLEKVLKSRHQTPTKNKSTEMLCMVNTIVRIGNMDTHQCFDETAGSNRDVVLTQNVKDILQRQGDK